MQSFRPKGKRIGGNVRYRARRPSSSDGYATAAPVKSFPPNGYGLYDMSGNVAEWCLDAYQKNFYSYSPTKNPIAQYMDIESLLRSFQAVHTKRVVRGGGALVNHSVWIIVCLSKQTVSSSSLVFVV